MQLHEECRPRTWPEVVGQDKALARIETLRRRGLGGRAFFVSGQSGTGQDDDRPATGHGDRGRILH